MRNCTSQQENFLEVQSPYMATLEQVGAFVRAHWVLTDAGNSMAAGMRISPGGTSSPYTGPGMADIVNGSKNVGVLKCNAGKDCASGIWRTRCAENGKATTVGSVGLQGWRLSFARVRWRAKSLWGNFSLPAFLLGQNGHLGDHSQWRAAISIVIGVGLAGTRCRSNTPL